MPRGRLKLEPITNISARNRTFRKRTSNIIKKVSELSTLCGVKACAIINGCDNTEPEFSPSKEGAEEVCAKFMEVLPEDRSKKMYDQERYLWERIQKGREKAMQLHAENREIELREVMFDLLKGKTMSPHHSSDPGFLEELNLFIGSYVNRVTRRTEILEENGEPVPPNIAVTDASAPVVGLVGNLAEVNVHMRQEPFQYHTHANFFYQSQPRLYGSSQDMYTGVNHDQGQSSNQYPNSNESWMSLLMEQPHQMSDVQDLANVASMDDNNNYHQLPNTSQMPSTTSTTTDADLSGHCVNNKRWPTRFGLD